MSLAEAYSACTLDPLLLRPWEIARLTDFQITELYAKPAAKRAREREKEQPGGAPSTAPTEAITEAAERNEPPSRTAIMNFYLSQGATVQEAERQADKVLHEMATAPADAWWRTAGTPPGGV